MGAAVLIQNNTTHALPPKRRRGRPRRASMQHTAPRYTYFGAIVKGVNYTKFEYTEPKRQQRLLDLKLKPIEDVTFDEIAGYTRDQLRGYGYVYGFPRMTKPAMVKLLIEAAAFFHPGDPKYNAKKFLENMHKPPVFYEDYNKENINGDLIIGMPVLPPLPPLPQTPMGNTVLCESNAISRLTASGSSRVSLAEFTQKNKGDHSMASYITDKPNNAFPTCSITDQNIPLTNHPVCETSPSNDNAALESNQHKLLKFSSPAYNKDKDIKQEQTTSAVSAVMLGNEQLATDGVVKFTVYPVNDGEESTIVFMDLENPEDNKPQIQATQSAQQLNADISQQYQELQPARHLQQDTTDAQGFLHQQHRDVQAVQRIKPGITDQQKYLHPQYQEVQQMQQIQQGMADPHNYPYPQYQEHQMSEYPYQQHSQARHMPNNAADNLQYQRPQTAQRHVAQHQLSQLPQVQPHHQDIPPFSPKKCPTITDDSAGRKKEENDYVTVKGVQRLLEESLSPLADNIQVLRDILDGISPSST